MSDIRPLAGRIFLLVLLATAACLTWQWSVTIWLYDHQGRYWGTIADWVQTWFSMVAQDPIGVTLYSGWGRFETERPLIGILILIVGWIVGRTNLWHKHFPECNIVDANREYLAWLCISIPTLLSIFGTGAKLNLYWDFLLQTTFFPWHFWAHFVGGYIFGSLISPIDHEGIFKLKYRYKFFTVLVVGWISSMVIEVRENLMVLIYGLRPEMSNWIIDSLPIDHAGVLFGFTVGLLAFNGFRYRE
jgi:hypothetical protein